MSLNGAVDPSLRRVSSPTSPSVSATSPSFRAASPGSYASPPPSSAASAAFAFGSGPEASEGATPSDEQGRELLRELQGATAYEQFFKDPFDPSRYANNIIQGSSIAESLATLTAGVQRLDAEVKRQVATHHEDLLARASGIEKLDDVLRMVTGRVDGLRKSAARIQDKLQQPYQKIVTRNAQLARLQAACEILRRTMRYLYLARRLREQLKGGTREIAKAAHTLSEIASLTEDIDLAGVEAVDAEAAFVFQTRATIEQQATQMLAQGLESQSQAQVATSLQVFRNLDQLQQQVDAVVAARLKSVRDSARDTTTPPPAAKPANGGPTASLSPADRAALWTRLERLMNTIYAAVVQVRHLERMLLKKRDPGTQQPFSELLAPTKSGLGLAHDFWLSVTDALATRFVEAQRTQPALTKPFETEFPKLLRVMHDLSDRLDAKTPIGQQSQAAERLALRRSVEVFENAYLNSSVSRMFDPVHVIFPESNDHTPSPGEVASVCRTMKKELEVASMDPQLFVSVARNLAKTVKLFCVKSEQMRANDPSSLAVPTAPGVACPESLRRNVALANRVHQVRAAVIGLVNKSPAAEEAAQRALEEASSFIGGVTEPLFDTVRRLLGDTIAQMHAEDYFQGGGGVGGGGGGAGGHGPGSGGRGPEPDAPCSRYVHTLQEQVTTLQSELFEQMHCDAERVRGVRRILEHCLDQFVLHASLIDRMAEAGKLRLAADMAQFELALAPLQASADMRLVDLGQPYKALRAFRPLLFLETPQFVASPSIGQTFPRSVALQHLFSLANALPSSQGRNTEPMHPPHVLQGCTEQMYVEWLLGVSETRRLTAIREALDKYARRVTELGQKEFCPLYPAMLSLLKGSD